MLAAAVAASSTSSTWLRARPIRYVVLLLCSPILLPFLCAAFPLLCAAELCLRLCRRRRGKIAGDSDDDDDDERLRRCEEGYSSRRDAAESGGEEIGIMLLQRYLEDQLLLVGSMMYDCGDDGKLLEEDFGAGDDRDSRAPLLS
ncbi:hypothetical protein TIFTF001_020961 [Ficus carica]|uniref:Uncharacterized protein n=1 Tax=Ficus carica TaxID=3494 RepID=A0AA88ABR7_FICCA|nr:hypothetical protein TIFTF001_020961 [Ficus carica]